MALDQPLEDGDVSLDGMKAALLYVDQIQGRVGTVTALVARGDKAASQVPVAPKLPVVRAVSASHEPPFSARRADELSGTIPGHDSGCDRTEFMQSSTYRLDARHSLVILLEPGADGSQVKDNEILAIADDAAPNRLEVARFDVRIEDGQVIGAKWDPSTGILSFGPDSDRYVWDGERFRIVRVTEPAFVGWRLPTPSDTITLYRARVMR